MKIKPICAGIVKKLRSAKKPSYQLALRLIKKSPLRGVLSEPQIKHLARLLADGKMTGEEISNFWKNHATKIRRDKKVITIPGWKTWAGTAAAAFYDLTRYTERENALWQDFKKRNPLAFPLPVSSRAECSFGFWKQTAITVGGRIICSRYPNDLNLPPGARIGSSPYPREISEIPSHRSHRSRSLPSQNVMRTMIPRILRRKP